MDIDGREDEPEAHCRNENVSFLALRCFKQWWSRTDSTTHKLLEGARQLARVDERAVDWDALAGALWWLDSRTLMGDGKLVVNGPRWVTEGCPSCPS